MYIVSNSPPKLIQSNKAFKVVFNTSHNCVIMQEVILRSEECAESAIQGVYFQLMHTA